MIDATPVEFPVEPLKHFEHEAEPLYSDSFKILKAPENTQIDGKSWNQISSSSYPGTLATLSPRLWLEPHRSTESWFSIFDVVTDLLHAERRAAFVKASDAPENLFELRRLTGFTWNHLAKLLNVDRRTLNNWVKGANIRDNNREHIAKTLQVLRYADRGSAVLNAAALCEQRGPNKSSPLEEIRVGDYESAKRCLSYGNQQPGSWKVTREVMFWSGELQPILMHENADGTEKNELIPDEPAPASRKRTIRRN